MVLSVLCYNSETWTLTAETNRQLRVFEMGCLRRIMDVTRRDHIRNVDIRANLGITEDIVERIQAIQARRLRYFGYVVRMDVVECCGWTFHRYNMSVSRTEHIHSQPFTLSLSHQLTQVGARPDSRCDMRPFRIISDKYHKNEAFPLVKCIPRYVSWFDVNRSTFEEDMSRK